MNARQIIVVDVETNGLDLDRHEAVEVAWWNLTTDERGRFIPAHDVRQVLHDADIRALQINRYIDRIATEAYRVWLPQLDELAGHLMGEEGDGATLAGSNPAFDAAMLSKLLRRAAAEDPDDQYAFEDQPWHYRLWDLSAYAAGVLSLDEVPGLFTVCQLLDVPPPDHTAEGDVTATGLCFRALQQRARTRTTAAPTAETGARS